MGSGRRWNTADGLRNRIRPSKGGGYDLRLAAEDALLTVLPGHLISLLESVGETPQDNLPEALRRLLPLAYPTDPTPSPPISR